MNQDNEDDKYGPPINSARLIDSIPDSSIKISSLNCSTTMDNLSISSGPPTGKTLIVNMRPQSPDYSTLEKDNDVPDGELSLFHRRYDNHYDSHYLNKRKLPSKNEDQLSLVENMSGFANGLDAIRLDDEVFNYENCNEQFNQKKKAAYKYSTNSMRLESRSDESLNEEDKNEIDLISFTDDTTSDGLKRKDEDLKNFDKHLDKNFNKNFSKNFNKSFDLEGKFRKVD